MTKPIPWIAAAIVLVAAGCGSGQSAMNPTATQSVTRIKLDPTKWIAYQTCMRCDGVDGQVWLVHPDGSGDHEVSGQLQNAVHPDFSRDGKWLAYNDEPAEPAQIYVAHADGSGTQIVGRCVPPLCLGHERPAWSPDGLRLALTVDFGPPKDDLPIANGIAILDLASGKLTQVTKHLNQPGAPDAGQDMHPRWSPDSRSLVFFRERPAQGEAGQTTAIFIVGSDGASPRQLTPWDEAGSDPDWSPDGSKIVYGTHTPGEDINWPGQVESEIVTIRPDGTGRTVLTNFGRGGPRAWRPLWILDGAAILYTKFSKPGSPESHQIWAIGADGRSDTPLVAIKPIMDNAALQP